MTTRGQHFPPGILGQPNSINMLRLALRREKMKEAEHANTPPGASEVKALLGSAPRVSGSPTERAMQSMQEQRHAPSNMLDYEAPKESRAPNMLMLGLGAAGSIMTANPIPLLMAAGAAASDKAVKDEKSDAYKKMAEYAQRESRGDYDPREELAFNPILGRHNMVTERPKADRMTDLARISPQLAFEQSMAERAARNAPHKPLTDIGKAEADFRAGFMTPVERQSVGRGEMANLVHTRTGQTRAFRQGSQEYVKALEGGAWALGGNYSAPTPEKPSAPDIEMDRLADLYPDMSEQDRFDIAYGNSQVVTETNPLNGQSSTFIVSKTRGTRKPLTEIGTPPDAGQGMPKNVQEQPTEPPGGNPIYSAPLLSQVGNLGGSPAFKEMGARATAGAYDAGPDVNVPRQNFRLLKQSIYSMYGGSKMSNQDKAELDTTLASLGVFESSERAYDALATWYAKAHRMEQDQYKTMNDPSMPVPMRQAAAAKAQGAREVMSIIGSPAEIARPGGAPQSSDGMPQITSESEYGLLTPGTKYRDPDGNVRVKQ